MAWHDNNKALTHVASYDSARDASWEAEAAVQKGWIPQSTAATDGHINVGRTVAQVELFGAGSLIFGASRTNGKIVITYVRTPDRYVEQEKIKESIQELDQVIRSKLPALNTAKQERDHARMVVNQCRAGENEVTNAIKSISDGVLDSTSQCISMAGHWTGDALSLERTRSGL